MDEFMKFVRTLPKALDEKEQEFLLYEYAKTRDPQIREKLIIHNQLLCAHIAIKYTRKHNNTYMIDEVFSDCIVALVKAIEKYVVASGGSFAGFACACMEQDLFNIYLKNSKDALLHVHELDVLDKDEEEIEEGLFYFLFDEKESGFADEYASNAFVADICNFISSWENEKCSLAVMMYAGINGYKKLSQSEIGKVLNISQPRVCKLLKDGLLDIKKYIAENYPNTFPDIYKEMAGKKEFDSIKERNAYIIDKYFGLSGEHLTLMQIADNLGVKHKVISAVVDGYRYRKTQSEDNKEISLNHNARRKLYTEEIANDIFNAFYGLNGYTPHTIKELIKILNLTISEQSCCMIVANVKNRLIGEGEYSEDDFKELDKKRNDFFKKEKVKEYEGTYNSYYGLNGCERKTCVQLSQELGVTHNTILRRVHAYNEYLESIKERESVDE